MKKILSVILSILVYTSAFCQQSSPQTQFTKQDYLQKSKKQVKTGLILLGGGTALFVSGIIAYQKGPGGLILMGLGLLSDASSVPFFVASTLNKSKANKMAFNLKLEKAISLVKTDVALINYPALSLTFKLK